MIERRVPDVIIGGAPRSGTTFLCEALSKNCDIYVARPFIPEPKVLLGLPATNRDSTVLDRYAKLFATASDDVVLIEKCSYYLENIGARDLFRRLLPHTKIVFILRDPVARAFSNWVRSSKNGLETLDFPTAIANEASRSDPFSPERDYVRPFDYLNRSRYGTLIKAWIDALGSTDRLSVVQFEALIDNPGQILRDLQLFIGVKPRPWEEIATGVVNSNEPTQASIDPGIAAAIRNTLLSEMRLLAELTNINIERWGM